MIESIAGAALGLVAGRVVRLIANRLPDFLFQQWRDEAVEFLALENAPDSCTTKSTAKVHFLKRGYLPELLTALLSAIAIGVFGFTVLGAAVLALIWGLMSLVLIDAEHQILPDLIVYPMLWLGLVANQQRLFVQLDDALYGALAGYMVLWVCLTGFKVVTGRDGMGRGDLKMLAMLGAWGGWQLLPLIFLVSSTTAAVYGLAAKCLSKCETGPQYPFGPFLAIGGFVAIVCGPAIATGHLL